MCDTKLYSQTQNFGMVYYFRIFQHILIVLLYKTRKGNMCQNLFTLIFHLFNQNALIWQIVRHGLKFQLLIWCSFFLLNIESGKITKISNPLNEILKRTYIHSNHTWIIFMGKLVRGFGSLAVFRFRRISFPSSITFL